MAKDKPKGTGGDYDYVGPRKKAAEERRKKKDAAEKG